MLENTSTEAPVSTTPTAAETVESTATPTNTAVETQTPSDPWDFSDVAEKAEEPIVKTEAEKPIETTEEKVEKPLEEQVLDEVFKDDAEKPDESKEDDSENMDPQEILDRQRNATARAAAERNLKKAAIVKKFQFPDKESGAFVPITEIAKEFETLNPTRFTELSQHAAHKLVDANPDAAFQRAYAVKMLSISPIWNPQTATLPTLDEFIAFQHGKPVETTKAPSSELSQLVIDLDKDAEINWDWRNPELDGNFDDPRELALVKSLRQAMATAESESSAKTELQTKLEKIEKDVQGLAENKTSVIETQRKTFLDEEIVTFRSDIETALKPHILRNAGLEVTKDDPPQIIAFKEKQAKLFENRPTQDSPFETFAFEESSVKTTLMTAAERLVGMQAQVAEARRLNNDAEVQRLRGEIKDERIPFMQLLGKAAKEYSEREIKPLLELIVQNSQKSAAPIKEQMLRQEVVSNGSSLGADRPAPKNYTTAEDVWDSMIPEAEADQRLRAGA